jgi:hypothetical protein
MMSLNTQCKRLILTTLMLLSIMTTLPLSAQTDPAVGLDIIAAINKGFQTLDLKLTELFRTADTSADIKLSTTASQGYTGLANSILAAPTKQSSKDSSSSLLTNIESSIIAGYTHTPKVGGSNVLGNFSRSDATIAQYIKYLALIKTTQFNSFDYPFNPSKGNNAYKPDQDAAQYLSFDALLAGSPNSDRYMATLLDPAGIPPSIQDYIFSQYGKNDANKKLFDKQKNNEVLRPDGKTLVVNLQKYQGKRRKFLALQSVVISNLQAIKRMGAGDQSTKGTLLALTNQKDQINQASAITVARLNLMANIIIADELSKRREIDQRMLSTLTMTLLQTLDQAKQSMEVSTDGSDYKSVTNFIDQNFLGKKDTTPNVTPSA